MANDTLPDQGVSRPVHSDINRLCAAVTAIRALPELLKPYTVHFTKLRLPKEIGDPMCDAVKQLGEMIYRVHYEGVDYEYQDEAQDEADLRARVERLGYRLYVTADGAQLVVDHFPNSDRVPEVVFIHTDDGDDDLKEWIADREQVSDRVRHGTNASDGLRRAAEGVIKLYRDGKLGRALAGETDGGYKPLPELEEALGALDTALEVETDTAEVLARQGLKRIGPNEEFATAVAEQVDALDRARDDAQRAVYAVISLVKAAKALANDDEDEVLGIALERLRELANALDSVNFGKSS